MNVAFARREAVATQARHLRPTSITLIPYASPTYVVLVQTHGSGRACHRHVRGRAFHIQLPIGRDAHEASAASEEGIPAADARPPSRTAYPASQARETPVARNEQYQPEETALAHV